MSQNDFSVFFERKISGAFLILAIVMVIVTFVTQMMKMKRKTDIRKDNS